MGVQKVNKLGVQLVKKGAERGEESRNRDAKSKARGLMGPKAQPRA